MQFPKKLQKKLQDRKDRNALRQLPENVKLVDFSSNDYLGFASEKRIFNRIQEYLKKNKLHQNGATGSRLLTGNNELYDEVEVMLSGFHNADAALLFNSGYDANVGFFSSIPQRGDIIFYDELIHASIRDGILMSNAGSYKFKHNDLNDLERRFKQVVSNKTENQEIYIVTESVFSMDGDVPNLEGVVQFSKDRKCHLIVDEAHAIGVFGTRGVGLLQQLELENQVFARIITFGKSMGCHGAAVLGSEMMKSYLINFARSFIYTTGLPPHSLATIKAAYEELKVTTKIEDLHRNIHFFNQKLNQTNLKSLFIDSSSAIHCCIISGNENVKKIATRIRQIGFDVKPILYPTVPKGKERLRFCLHAYNSEAEISKVIELLTTFVAK